MKIRQEITGTQAPSFWNRMAGGFGLWGRTDPLEKAQRGSGSDEGQNPYDPQVGTPGAMGVGGSMLPQAIAAVVLPLTLPIYRTIARYDTVALAMAARKLTILAAETIVQADDELEGDPIAERGKAILKKEIIDRRSKLFRGCLQADDYGWKDFEVVYQRKDDPIIGKYVGVEKFKELAGDYVQFQIDEHGNLDGVIAGGKTLEAPYFLHIVHDREDDNWWGRSIFENIRRAWANALRLEDLLMELTMRAMGKAVRVAVPPENPKREDKTKRPNLEAGLKTAKAVAEGKATAYYQTGGFTADELTRNPELQKLKLVDIDVLDIGSPGPMIGALDTRLGTLEKKMIRGLLLPERTLTEASTGGSRADSQTHGDVATAGAEARHEEIVEQLNDQTVAALIRENCGEEYVGRIKLVAVPLQDERRDALEKLFDAFLQDDGFRRGMIDAIGPNGVQTMVEKLALSIKFAAPFQMPEPEAPGPQVVGGTDGSDDENLSAWCDKFETLLPMNAGHDAGQALRRKFTARDSEIEAALKLVRLLKRAA